MKLAEALVQRADLQRRMEQLRCRLEMNAKVQEGESPAEEPRKLLAELEQLAGQLEALITRINLTNAATVVEDTTLTGLLARREILGSRINILRNFLAEASSTVMRGTRSEVVVRSTVPVAELQKQVDDDSQTLRELDLKIQGLNWTTELG